MAMNSIASRVSKVCKLIAFFPENSLFSTNGVVFKPLENTSHRYEIMLATNNQNPNPAVKIFTDFVRDNK